MIARLFHAWERKLAKVTTDRIVRGFDWGLDWIDANASSGSAQDRLQKWSTNIMVDTDQFFYTPPTNQYQLRGSILTFPSHLQTPHPENNTVHARYFAAGDGGILGCYVLDDADVDDESFGHALLLDNVPGGVGRE